MNSRGVDRWGFLAGVEIWSRHFLVRQMAIVLFVGRVFSSRVMVAAADPAVSWLVTCLAFAKPFGSNTGMRISLGYG